MPLSLLSFECDSTIVFADKSPWDGGDVGGGSEVTAASLDATVAVETCARLFGGSRAHPLLTFVPFITLPSKCMGAPARYDGGASSLARKYASA